MMRLEVLISAVNANPEELIEKMNISTDAILINQCGHTSVENISLSKGNVNVFNVDEKGVGKSRNMAIKSARNDVILFSDDDIRYVEDYENIILREFKMHPEAEGLFFNVEVCEARRTYYNMDFARVHIWNGGRYPAYSIALRRECLERKGVSFSELFGGGAKYSCGEDSLFIRDCLRAGIRMYRTPALIGKEEPRKGGESTWFKGYNVKFFYDRGVLYRFLYGILAPAVGLRFVFKNRKLMCSEIAWEKAYIILLQGVFCRESSKEYREQNG